MIPEVIDMGLGYCTTCKGEGPRTQIIDDSGHRQLVMEAHGTCKRKWLGVLILPGDPPLTTNLPWFNTWEEYEKHLKDQGYKSQ